MKRVKGSWITGLVLTLAATSSTLENSSAASSDTNAANLAGYGYTAAEFMADEEVERALPVLAQRGVGLAIPFTAGKPWSFELVKQATARGVEVRPWLLLPDADGYFANSTNAERYDQQARALIDRWLAEGLAPTTLVVDMEMPVQRALRFAEIAKQVDNQALARFLVSGIDRAQYARATHIYRALVEYGHARGFRMQVTTLAQVLDDYVDGDDGLRQALQIPIDGIAWDDVNVQVYRTLNALVLSRVAGPTGPHFVYDYARRVRAVFGERGSVSIGCTDPGELTPEAPSYRSGLDLIADVDAAAAAGIPRSHIAVYGLRGIVRRPPMAQWFLPRSPDVHAPFPDLPTAITRSSSALLDAQL